MDPRFMQSVILYAADSVFLGYQNLLECMKYSLPKSCISTILKKSSLKFVFVPYSSPIIFKAWSKEFLLWKFKIKAVKIALICVNAFTFLSSPDPFKSKQMKIILCSSFLSWMNMNSVGSKRKHWKGLGKLMVHCKKQTLNLLWWSRMMKSNICFNMHHLIQQNRKL